MTTGVILRKFDNGFNADILTCTDSAFLVGRDIRIFNRGFHQFPKGSLIAAEFNLGPNGRARLLSCSATATVVDLGFNTRYFSQVNDATGGESMSVESKKARKENPLVGYYISPEAKMVFTTAHNMLLDKPERAVKVMMSGPSGYGKTTLPRLLAEVTGRNFYRMNCASVRDPEEWFGYREAQKGSTVFIKSEFIKTVESGNAVVVLDEFNRLEPWLHNTLFPLLDDDGCTVVHDEKFCIGADVLVVGTINTGYQYTGTFELDEALGNRFDFSLEVGPMPHSEEVDVLMKRTGINQMDAADIVKTANALRGESLPCSTRSTLEIARMVVTGLQLREAFEFSVVRRIPVDDSGAGQRKKAIDMLNARHSNFTTRVLANDVFGTVAPKEAFKVKDVIIEVADGFTLKMRSKEGEILRMIQAVNFLKEANMKAAGDSPLKEAKRVVEQLQYGNVIEVDFIGSKVQANVLCATLAKVGVLASLKEIS